MSIILKGIDMPKDCKGIELVFIPKDGDVVYCSESMSIGADQIVEIPTPHGRLIDGDKLKTRLYGYERWTGIDEAPYEYAENEVYDAPTILESEE